MSYSVLIVDDEPLARQIIRDYLCDYADFKICGECDNGSDAVTMINEIEPEVVFMDIQMPEMTGIEVIDHLEKLPHIVFSTAYDEYAIKAFEINALDYLLKPFDENRFAKTMQRLRQELNEPRSDVRQLEALLNTYRSPADSFLKRILVPDKEQFVFVSVDDVFYIEAMENYIKIVTDSNFYILLQKLSEIGAKLNPQDFFHIHRSYIVNVNQVQKIEAWMKSSYRVVLKNGETLPLSRRRVHEFKQCFGFS
jgi:two-component system LytT family response regulator